MNHLALPLLAYMYAYCAQPTSMWNTCPCSTQVQPQRLLSSISMYYPGRRLPLVTPTQSRKSKNRHYYLWVIVKWVTMEQISFFILEFVFGQQKTPRRPHVSLSMQTTRWRPFRTTIFEGKQSTMDSMSFDKNTDILGAYKFTTINDVNQHV